MALATCRSGSLEVVKEGGFRPAIQSTAYADQSTDYITAALKIRRYVGTPSVSAEHRRIFMLQGCRQATGQTTDLKGQALVLQRLRPEIQEQTDFVTGGL